MDSIPLFAPGSDTSPGPHTFFSLAPPNPRAAPAAGSDKVSQKRVAAPITASASTPSSRYARCPIKSPAEWIPNGEFVLSFHVLSALDDT